MLERKVDQVLIVLGRGVSDISDNSFTGSESTIFEASPVASDQDRFGAAYEAFRDLSAGLYDIDTRQCARGVTRRCTGRQVEWWPGEVTRIGSLASQLAIGATNDPTWGALQASWQAPWGLLLSDPGYQGCTQWKDIPDSHALEIDPRWISGWYHCVADVVSWTMAQRSCLTRTLNLCWHKGFGSFRFTGNCSTVHFATGQVQHQRELGVALAWLSLSARRTRSRKEREGFMTECQTGEASPSGLGRAAWLKHAVCVVSAKVGAYGCTVVFLACRQIQGSFLIIVSVGSLPEGFPKIPPGAMPGTNLGKMLLVPVEQRQRWTALKWCTKSGNAHCQVQQSCRCWM